MRKFLLLSLFFFIVLVNTATAQQITEATEPATLTQADLHKLHMSLTTVDTHIDIPANLATSVADPALDGPMQVDVPKMIKGGLDVGFFIVYVRQDSLTDAGYDMAYQQAMAKFDAIDRLVKQNPYNIGLARSPEEAKSLIAENKLVAVIGVENGYSLGADLEHLDEFHQRGAQYISFAHFGNNQLADSSEPKGEYPDSPEPVHHGLSDLGKQALQRMNELGIMVDISHTSKETTLQAAKLSSAPIIASHSSVKAVYDHSRNLTDEEMLAIAEGGGVVQIVAYDSYLRKVPAEQPEKILEIRENMGLTGETGYAKATLKQQGELRRRINALDSQWPRATIQTLADHIDYAVKLIGIEHVGIASDFGGGGGVKGWDDASETPNVTLELIQRGYSESDLEKLWGGNLFRVWGEVKEIGEEINLPQSDQ